VLLTLGPALLLVNIYLVYRAIALNRELKIYEYDYATLNSIKYGLLNEHVWKAQISKILTQEIENAMQSKNLQPKLSKAIKNTIEAEIENILPDFDLLFISKSDIMATIRESELSAKIVSHLTGMALDIADEMEIEKILFNGLSLAFGEIRQSEEKILSVINKYQCKDFDDCDTFLFREILLASEEEDNLLLYSVFITLALIIVILLMARSFRKTAFLLLTATSVTLLIPGLILPFINLDARIEYIGVTLFGQEITFFNQVVMFQSKSILEIVGSLLSHPDTKVIAVGILVLLFSLVTPVFKLIFSLLIHLGIIKSRVIANFVLTLGKWSMADVFTVALFMSYLGMSGLVNSNLSQLDQQTADTIINTANYTHFKPGLIYFAGFTLVGMVGAYFIKSPQKKVNTKPDCNPEL
jgi:hypothetical protein